LLAGFGLLITAAAITMIRSCRRPLGAATRTRRLPVLLGLGATVGMITGMVGAGGGFVIVPVLVLLAGVSMTTAVGTSLLIITLQSGAGLVGHLHHGSINWPLTLAVTALAITGSLIGARLSDRIPAQLLRTSFGWFLTAMAALVLAEQAPVSLRLALAGTSAGRILLTGASAVLVLAAVRHVHSCRMLARSQRLPSG
jgi:uncharacterized membrane protein YfcA